MPRVKGQSARQAILRCYHCSGHTFHVERASNTRMIHGKKRVVANVVCQNTNCRNEWWSYHPDAIKAMRAADKRDAAIAQLDGSKVVINGEEVAA